VVVMRERTQIGRLLHEHVDSLPMYRDRDGLGRHLPWLLPYVGVPLAVTTFGRFLDLAPSGISAPLLAGVGVLTGLLFQVLAWISGRVGTVADAMGDKRPTKYDLALIERLDIARANVAYACLVSITLVVTLSAGAIVRDEPDWLRLVNVALLAHLCLTLVLVLVRINNIGQDDRVTALTSYARSEKDT
jgi:multidrug transporter EmrE-like cation transporter